MSNFGPRRQAVPWAMPSMRVTIDGDPNHYYDVHQNRIYWYSPEYQPMAESRYYDNLSQSQRESLGIPRSLWLKEGQDYSESSYERKNKRYQTASEVVSAIASLIPYFGSAASNILNIVNKKNATESYNRRMTAETERANRFNSPGEQMRRMRAAGINPFYAVNDVRNMPYEIPSISMYEPPMVSAPSSLDWAKYGLEQEKFEVNREYIMSKIDNLDSLTDLNIYKETVLYPQISTKNGYVNSLLNLQVAWENNNYDAERWYKQQILNLAYLQDLTEFGAAVLRLEPQKVGYKTIIDTVQGTCYFIDEKGNRVDPSQLTFNELPYELQGLVYKAYDEHMLKMAQTSSAFASAKASRASAETTSILGGLYNTRKGILDYSFNQYKFDGTWPTDDAFIRAASGHMDFSTIMGAEGIKLGFNAANAGLDVAKFAATKGLNNAPKVLAPKTPKGATPYVFGNAPVFNTGYNHIPSY